MLTIHHARHARSVRVIWLCEELGLPYRLSPVAFDPAALARPEYRALHPLGQIPVVEDGEITLYESGAIVQYLLERHGAGRLEPAAAGPAAARAEYLQWFHYGEATVARCCQDIVRARFQKPESERVPEVLPQARKRYASALGVVERRLEQREFICGQFSAADIMLSYGISVGKIVGELPSDLPHVAAYLARLKARPAYARAWVA